MNDTYKVSKILGSNIKRFRNEQGYTQKALAEKLYVSQPTIKKWEHGDTLPATDRLADIADLLDVTLDQLFGRDKVDNKKNKHSFSHKDVISSLFEIYEVSDVKFCEPLKFMGGNPFGEIIRHPIYFDNDCIDDIIGAWNKIIEAIKGKEMDDVIEMWKKGILSEADDTKTPHEIKNLWNIVDDDDIPF